MPSLYHFQRHVEKIKNGPRPGIMGMSMMVFFFILFDGILGYVAPVTMKDAGLTEGTIGLLLGSSSIFGIFFDVFLLRVLKEAYHRRLFLAMFLLAALYPLTIVGQTSIGIFLVGMAIWGFYYDLYNLGTLDFIGRTASENDRAGTYGVLKVFEGLGYLVAPLVAGLLIASATTAGQLNALLWTLLVFSVSSYTLLVLRNGRGGTPPRQETDPPRAFLTEMHLWKKIGKILLPVLTLTLTINIIDSFFWTVGPLLSDSLAHQQELAGVWFLVIYGFPPLLAGWLVGAAVRIDGKKHAAYAAVFFGSLMLTGMFFANTTPILALFIAFFSSLFFSIAWPAINGAYADYVAESPHYERQIMTVQDAFTNLGDIIGPVLAGFAAQYLGYMTAFAVLGIWGMAIAVVLFVVTPREINVRV